MNILAAQLSDKQEVIIKAIARNQIRNLINVSADHQLLSDFPPETRKSVLSQLLRDFSKLVQTPAQLFNVHKDSDALFRHELFNLTYGSNNPNMSDYNEYSSEVNNLWKKLTVAGNFKHFNLQ